ncbi:MAG: glycosyltransferase family 2 protein [bacterium]
MNVLSIVIPLFNERRSLAPLAAQLGLALDGLGGESEILFVDDGSSDGSLEALRALADVDARVRVLRLRTHNGKAAALAAGFAAARGDVVVTMDADLQDDPAELPRFVAAIDAGFDLVSGRKRLRRDRRGKVVASRLFNAVVRRVFGVPLHDVNCGYKAYRRELIEQLHPYGELHRFIPVFAQGLGARIGEIDVRHSPRRHGASKYGGTRLPKALLDLLTVLLLTRYRDRPLHFFAVLALSGAGAAALLCIAALGLDRLGVVHLSGVWLAALAGVIVVLMGQCLVAGLLAEQRRAASPPHNAALCEEYTPVARPARRVSHG